jgi:hypothetical protein
VVHLDVMVLKIGDLLHDRADDAADDFGMVERGDAKVVTERLGEDAVGVTKGSVIWLRSGGRVDAKRTILPFAFQINASRSRLCPSRTSISRRIGDEQLGLVRPERGQVAWAYGRESTRANNQVQDRERKRTNQSGVGRRLAASLRSSFFWWGQTK